MRYALYRRAHPEWPRRLGDMVGRRVRLRESLRTRAGVIFLRDTVLQVDATWGGRVSLARLGCPGRCVSHVRLPALEPLPVVGEGARG